MIVLKYVKQGDSRFISHIDLLRHVSRVLRRADIPVKRSNGFNPHSLVYFSPPLALGVTSRAEYLAIDVDMPAAEVMERYNSAVPDGLRAIEAFECKKNPNLQAGIYCADYLYPYPYPHPDADFSHAVIQYVKKGETVTEDVTSKIICAQGVGGALCLRLATGGVNLRPDRLLPMLEGIYGARASVTDIVKLRQYVRLDGKPLPVDDLLRDHPACDFKW